MHQTKPSNSVSATDLAGLMTCETQVQLNARHGKKRAASAEVYTRRGDAEHARRHKQVMRVHAKARRASADSRCFIATAVYGESAWETEQLRLWRDRCLRSSVLGRLFIALYYRLSPPLARWLQAHPMAARCVRRVLDKWVDRIHRACSAPGERPEARP